MVVWRILNKAVQWSTQLHCRIPNNPSVFILKYYVFQFLVAVRHFMELINRVLSGSWAMEQTSICVQLEGAEKRRGHTDRRSAQHRVTSTSGVWAELHPTDSTVHVTAKGRNISVDRVFDHLTSPQTPFQLKLLPAHQPSSAVLFSSSAKPLHTLFIRLLVAMVIPWFWLHTVHCYLLKWCSPR